MTMTNIEPKTETTTKVYNKFEITEVKVKPNEKATLSVMLYNNSTPVKQTTVVLEGQDYSNWSENDYPYLVDKVCEKLGFVKTV